MQALRQMIKQSGSLFVALVAFTPLARAQGTFQRAIDPNAPRILIPALCSTEKNLGVLASDALRSRIGQDIPFKELYALPKNDIAATLEASGFPPSECLSVNDAKQLAQLLRADEYISGRVTKAGAGFRLETAIVLPKAENPILQPLPTVEGARLDQAAMLFSREFRSAMKQIAAEKKCSNLAREGKYDEAAAAAREGIAVYANSTLARSCLLTVMSAKKAPIDTVVAVANQILAVDPRSRLALGIVGDVYSRELSALRDKVRAGDTAMVTLSAMTHFDSLSISAYTRLLELEKNNTRLVSQIVEAIAQSRNPRVAIPIVDTAVMQNPGDPDLLNVAFKVHRAARDYKRAITMGEELAKADTAKADTLYYTYMGALYLTDSQPQRAAQVLALGTQKFPQNPNLGLTYVQVLRRIGQTDQAKSVLARMAQTMPNEKGILTEVAKIQLEQNQQDSALVTLRLAAAKGDSLPTLAQIALVEGNKWYKKGNGSKSIPDFEVAKRFLLLSDSLSTTPTAAFLLGATAFTVGQIAATDAPKTKSCQLARQAQENFTQAAIYIPKGARDPQFQANATQLLGYLGQFTPVVESQVKSFCK